MVDSRFFHNAGPFPLLRLAELTGAELARGEDAARTIRDVAPLDRAGENDVSFLDNVKYIESFSHSQAGACFIRARYADKAPASMTLLLTEEPYRSFALVARLFYPTTPAVSGLSTHAHIAPTATLGKECTVEAGAVIEEEVEIGDRCHIGPNTVVHKGVVIGSDTVIGACCTLSHCLIGSYVILHRGVHIGQDGFGFAMGPGGHLKVPQLGRVIIENHVEIGSNSCIDRGTGPDTFIGEGSKIDNLVQIGHNVHIGRHAILVSQTGIAGSSRIGDGAVLAGQVGIAGHVKIGNNARLAAQSGVMGDIPAGAAYGGTPAMPIKDWHRQTIALNRLMKKKGVENE